MGEICPKHFFLFFLKRSQQQRVRKCPTIQTPEVIKQLQYIIGKYSTMKEIQPKDDTSHKCQALTLKRVERKVNRDLVVQILDVSHQGGNLSPDERRICHLPCLTRNLQLVSVAILGWKYVMGMREGHHRWLRSQTKLERYVFGFVLSAWVFSRFTTEIETRLNIPYWTAHSTKTTCEWEKSIFDVPLVLIVAGFKFAFRSCLTAEPRKRHSDTSCLRCYHSQSKMPPWRKSQTWATNPAPPSDEILIFPLQLCGSFCLSLLGTPCWGVQFTHNSDVYIHANLLENPLMLLTCCR